MPRLWKTQDRGFMLNLSLQYFNYGFKAILPIVSQQLADEYYDLEPGLASFYLAITALPYAFTLFYGIFCDSIPLFGSRKRNYIILMGFLQCAFLAPALFPIPNVKLGVFLLTANGFCGAVLTVVTNGLICIHSRIDPEYGSNDLWTYVWAVGGVGGFSGCILGGYLSSIGYGRVAYGLCSFIGLCVMISGFMIDKKKEQQLDTTSNLTIG